MTLTKTIPADLSHLPVASQIEQVPYSAHSFIAIAECGAGKSMVVPALEALMDESACIAVRAPAKIVCDGLLDGIRRFWPDIEVGIRTADQQRNLAKARLIIVSDGSLPALLKERGVTHYYADEAHVATVGGELDLALARKRGLKIRLMSATVDPAPFVRWLGADTPVVSLEGRTFPIERDTLPASPDLLDRNDQYELFGLVEECADELTASWERGLFFLPTKDLCEKASAHAEEWGIRSAYAHGGVYPPELREEVADWGDEPWLIFCTSAAATGITLDVHRVWIADEEIHGGTRLGTKFQGTRPVSDNLLLQMAGRAGRIREGLATLIVPDGNGRVVRDPSKWLSAQDNYRQQPVAPRPIELPCENTTPFDVVLAAAQHGLDLSDPNTLMSNLDASELQHTNEWLERTGCLRDGKLTKTGRTVAMLPLEPQYAHLVASAPDRDVKVALCAGLALHLRGSGSYDLPRTKPGRDWYAFRARNPGSTIWPPTDTVDGNVPLSLAAGLKSYLAAGDDWCDLNRLNSKPFFFALRAYRDCAGFFTKDVDGALRGLDLHDRDLRGRLDRHLAKHPLFRKKMLFKGKASGNGPFMPFDSVFAIAFDLENDPRPRTCFAIPVEKRMRKGGGSFWPLGFGIIWQGGDP